LTGLMSTVPANKLLPIVDGLFGSRADDAVAVFKKMGALSSRGAGEVAEEFSQELVSIYNSELKDRGFWEEVENRFGTFDKVMQFTVSSFVMGAGMGFGNTSEAQDLLNVDVSITGNSVKKRDGYGQYKSLGTGAGLHGGFHAFNSAGSDYQLWGSSTSLYSIVSDGSPTQLISSATVAATWDCTDTQGYSYCVNSSRNMYVKTDGTTINQYSSPLGTMVESTPDRVIVAGVSGSPNTLFVSQANTFTNFTVGVNPTDAFTEVIASPGSQLTHSRWGWGKLLWWKDASFGYFDFDDADVSPSWMSNTYPFFPDGNSLRLCTTELEVERLME